MLEPFAALLIEGRRPETSRRRSEAWRPAAAARNRSPREARDPRPPGTTTWLRGARCTDPGHAGDGSAAPGAQNRHGGAPRGERPASWQICDPWHSTGLHVSYRKPLALQNATLWRSIGLYATLLRYCGYSPDTKPNAEASRRQARNRHRPPSPRRAQKTLLDHDQPRFLP